MAAMDLDAERCEQKVSFKQKCVDSGDTICDVVTILSTRTLSRRPTHPVVWVEGADDCAGGHPCQCLSIVFHH